MGVPKTNVHIQTKIDVPNLSQDPPVPSEAPNKNFKD